MTLISKLAGGAAALALFAGGLAAPAFAASGGGLSNQDCFYYNQWTGWKAPSNNVLYLKVGMHDVYRVDLSVGSSLLTWGDSHLINQVRGPSTVCSAIDLDLSVADSNGFRTPLIARSITKLSKDEVAAIPPRYRP